MPPLDPGIALVLLAAGRGERFGGDKLRALFRGRPLWEWSAIAAEEAGFERRYVVIGDHSSIAQRSGWKRVVNSDCAQGMGTSIAAGVKASEESSRIVIALADMPLVAPSHLRELALGDGTVFTRHDDATMGCPAGFSRPVFEQLQGLRGEAGARSLALSGARPIDPPDQTTLADFDTRDDLSSAVQNKA